jgi:hypothetical protein
MSDVYIGRARIGEIRPVDDKMEARDDTGRRLGTFATSREAVTAICASYRRRALAFGASEGEVR